MQLAPMIAPAAASPMAAWEAAVGLMREFRQGENMGRNRGMAPNRPGRSRWPEADSLRGITRKGEERHLEGITAEGRAFPRAELGLPIVFHFKDPQDSPNNSELYPERNPESHRMASPVILRPLGIWGSAQALPMVLVLSAAPPAHLQLHFENKTTLSGIGPSEVRRPDLATYANSPMAGRSAAGSALEAFEAFAAQKGYRRL
jgi:CRISPR-associated protein Cmr1